MLFLKLYNPLNQNMCKQTLHPFRQAEFHSRKVWRKILLEKTFPMLRVRTAYPRPCCTCTLSPGSFRTFTFTPPGHSGKREDSVCLPSQPWLSVFFVFPWIVSKEPSYSVLNGKQVNAMNQEPLWNINVDDFQTFLHPKPCNHVFSCYLCLWPSGYYIFIPILDPFPHVIPHI